MEQNQDSSLFGLGIDPMSRAHLSEAARWAKFLAILGFIFCGIVVLLGIFAGSFMSSFSSSRYGRYDSDVDMSSFSVFAIVLYIIFAALCFIPNLFLFRFATKMKAALLTNEQETLNGSFQNLKIMYRYVGIFTIILLSIYVIFILIALVGIGASRM